jgi:uncharacterized protein
VIIFDVNVLVALHRDDHPHHETALQWFGELVERREDFSVLDETWASFVRFWTRRGLRSCE